MAKKIHTNVCIRCGQQRVASGTTEEMVNGSLVITTKMACPDPDCQEKVDAKFEKERVDREKLKNNGFTQGGFRGRYSNNTHKKADN